MGSVENMYPLPHMKDMLAHLVKGKIFMVGFEGGLLPC